MHFPYQSTPVSGSLSSRPSAALSAALARPETAQRASEEERGNVDQRRSRVWRHRRQLSNEIMRLKAVSLLRSVDAPGVGGVSICGTKPVAGGSASLRFNEATGRAFFGGLRRCNAVWTCARCSQLVSLKRRDEMNVMLAGARAENLSVYMVTLTARHGRDTQLAEFLSSLRNAKRRLAQRREWRGLPVEGSVTALEVTHGNRNGFHAHMHMLVLLSGDAAAGLKGLKALASVWRTCLQAFGLSGGKAAFDVRDGSSAGAYVTKWGAASELTLGAEKVPVAGSRTPWDLLADAADGDERAGRLWLEYARAFHGKQQLVWSNGLKKRFGIGELSDEAAAEAAEQSEAAEAAVQVLRIFSAEEWEIVRHRQFALLRAAERGACLDRAMRGPLDCERWRRLRGEVWQQWT